MTTSHLASHQENSEGLAFVETGVSAGLRRHDGERRQSAHQASNVIPAKAGTHASLDALSISKKAKGRQL
jgi:hypothetical protein